jgi:hypothetical protein
MPGPKVGGGSVVLVSRMPGQASVSTCWTGTRACSREDLDSVAERLNEAKINVGANFAD